MSKLVYIVAAAVALLGAGSFAYMQSGRSAAPKAASSQPAVAEAKSPASKPAEAKVDPIAGALASWGQPAPAAKSIVEPPRPPASIPKPNIAAKSKQKVKPKSAVPPKKVV